MKAGHRISDIALLWHRLYCQETGRVEKSPHTETPEMKKTRIFWLTFLGIVILQLFPFVLIGEYYVFMIYYTTFPFPILFTPLFDTLVRNLLAQILISVIASSCVWSLIITVVYSLLKRKQPIENGENNHANKT
jgi:hypothetical protein